MHTHVIYSNTLNVHIHNLFNSVCIVYPCSLGCSWKLVTLRDHLIMDNHPSTIVSRRQCINEMEQVAWDIPKHS